MNYRKIYDSLISKRKYIEVIPSDKPGQYHHIVPKCLGGKEVVRLTVREHIFAHELLVRIYRDEEKDENAYRRMLISIAFFYKTKSARKDHECIKLFRSRLIEKWVEESYRIRRTRVKIKNVKLKKSKWWDADKPFTDKMIADGWEYGQYLNEEQYLNVSRRSSDRTWIHKDGCPDKMVSPSIVQTYIDDGWKFGRTNLPPLFKIKRSLILKRMHKNEPDKINGRMKGRRWIHNPETNESRAILKNQTIPVGWIYGRSKINYNPDIYKKRKQFIQNVYKFFSVNNYDYELTSKKFNLKFDRHTFLQYCRKFLDNYKPRQQILTEKREALFNEYIKNGYDGCVKNLGYSGSKNTLCRIFRNNKMSVKGKCAPSTDTGVSFSYSTLSATSTSTSSPSGTKSG